MWWQVAIPFVLLILLDYLARLIRVVWRRSHVVAQEPLRAPGADGGGMISATSITVRCSRPSDEMRTGRLAGGYFFMCCPSVSKTSWHPMSLVRSQAGGFGDSVSLTFTIKGLGGWSRKIVAAAPALAEGNQTILLDGPFGRWSVDPREYSHVVVVCGGIGVTPFLALLDELFISRRRRDLPPPHVWFVWTLRETELFKHFEPTLRWASDRAGGARVRVHMTSHAVLPAVGVLSLPQPNSSSSVATVLQQQFSSPFSVGAEQQEEEELPQGSLSMLEGRPPLFELFDEVSDHYASHHDAGHATTAAAGKSMREGCAVLSCGPAGLVAQVTETLASNKARRHCEFELHTEVFEF